MRPLTGMLLTSGLLLATSFGAAQPPRGGGDEATKSAAVEREVARMMAFDKNKDGKLTRDEITDPRLLRLFERADANKDGVVTREEMEALFAREMPAGGGRGGFGPPGGGGFGGPGPGGFGGGGPGGFGGPPPQPGQILSRRWQDQLKLTDEQKKQLDELQKETDGRLDKILTDEQKKELRDMRDRRGGPGRPPRGPGGPGGGPGGRPPGEEPPPPPR